MTIEAPKPKLKRQKPHVIKKLESLLKVSLKKSKADTSIYEPLKALGLTSFSYSLNSAGEVSGLSIPEVGMDDISFLNDFKEIEYLNLSFNRIDSFDSVESLPKLRFLYLGKNRLSKISKLLQIAPNLELLAIFKNPISDFENITGFTNLKFLYCQEIGLSNISFATHMKNLRVLGVGRNKIAAIENLNLSHLQQLWIEDNKLKILPEEIARLFNWEALTSQRIYRNTSRKELTVNGNPFEFPPGSVMDLGAETLKNYYEAANSFGHTSLSEGRIIVIGDGGAGKSSLIDKLLFNRFSVGKGQTNGISIQEMILKHPEDSRDLHFHFWDFGGQEIQHAVHRFFFTEGCLYILVLDNRKEEEPEYWLQQIESLGGKAPVLIVFNKHDQNPIETADRKFLKEKYQNIVGFFNVSCESGFGIEDFKKSIEKEAIKLRTVDEKFPNNWLAIKKDIDIKTSGSKHYLTYEEYSQICVANDVLTKQTQTLLLRYLNTVGAVTWFGEDTHLKFLHVLDPAWITQGVYKILTSKKAAEKLGHITINDFEGMLAPANQDDYTYTEMHYGFILNMMTKFNLCYSPDEKSIFLPSLFGKEPKVEYKEFKGDDVRVYVLQFQHYMPMALIHRYITKKIPQAVDNNFWYTGVVIKDSKTSTLAMIHADREAKRIYVRVKGENKLVVWEQFRREFEEITISYAKITYDELVQLEESLPDSMIKYEDLVNHLRAKKEIYFHPKLQRDFNVGYLMGKFESKESTISKLKDGVISIPDTSGLKELPSFIVNILNQNSPTVSATATAHAEVDVDLNIKLVINTASEMKGDAQYLLDELKDTNQEIRDALNKIIEFGSAAKAARSSEEIKEKGWGRKLKSALEILSKSGDSLKKIKDGMDAMNSIKDKVSLLAQELNLSDIENLISILF